ncbi:hypothetical protein NP493_667g01070 [Ridgeia piscesae]|uniref:CHHC U11-48K-type domain-containing protein n=1 Tax=Ridgeia piscesae TaxID=27915 RepID=A0AAD9NNB7_RIDPI|nr:hypothetical protein NP493_667g01070 [Ridgeia piscesae]
MLCPPRDKDDQEKKPCSVDAGHIIPERTRDKHESYCSQIHRGYSREELDADQSSRFFYEKATTVVPVILDWSTCPLPLTSERYLSELSAEERCAVYDYCVATGKATNKMISFPKEQLMLLEDQEDKTDDQNKDIPEHLQQLMQERDLKRKRQKYRAKNVHITQKSHTEIIREVLANQMELLHRRWSDEERAKRKSDEKEEQINSEKDMEQSRKSWSHRSLDRRRHRSRDRSGGDDNSSRKRRHRSTSREDSPDRHRSDRHRHKHHKHKHHRHSRRHGDRDHDDSRHDTRKDDNRDNRDHDNNSSHKPDGSTGATDEENSLKMNKKEDLLAAVKKEDDVEKDSG